MVHLYVVDLPIQSGGSFHSYILVCQMVVTFEFSDLEVDLLSLHITTYHRIHVLLPGAYIAILAILLSGRYMAKITTIGNEYHLLVFIYIYMCI